MLFSSVGRDIEPGNYILNSKFNYAVVQDMPAINGAHMPRDPRSWAVLRTIADETHPVGFKALRDGHPEIGRADMRMLLDDLMRRDLIRNQGTGGAAQN